MAWATHGGSSCGCRPHLYSGDVYRGGARHLFDEMPSYREATRGDVLRVTVSHVLYPVTEGVLHQVFDAYGAEQVVVLERANLVEALVRFRSSRDAERARDVTHGRCVYEGCCWLDVQYTQPTPSDSVVATPTTCLTLGLSHNTDRSMAATTSMAVTLTTSTTSAAATTTSLVTGAREAPRDELKELAPKDTSEEPKKTVQELCEKILATLNSMIEGDRDINLDTISNVVEPAGHYVVSLPMPPATVKLSDIIVSTPVPPVIADSVLDQDSAGHKVLEERSDMSMMLPPWPPPTQGQLIKEVAWVIFDEIHYMKDRERGVVWEESIIFLPPAIKMVFLSATISNATEFAEWICNLHKQPCHVVYTDFWPTSLQHYVFPIEEVLCSLKPLPVSAADGIYLDWHLLLEGPCNREVGLAVERAADSEPAWVDSMDEDDRESLASVRMEGCGPLHGAASTGNMGICKYLVEQLGFDADADASNHDSGVTPLSCAVCHGKAIAVRYFLDKGADPNKKDSAGVAPLYDAAKEGYDGITRLLLSKGASVDVSSSEGTPLHVAASNGKSGVVKILLEHHANPNKVSADLGTPLAATLCATPERLDESACLKRMKLLVKASADLNCTIPDTPLVIATSKGLTFSVRYLLEVGANANIPRNHGGSTPIEIAANSGRRKLVESLFPFTSPIQAVSNWSVEGIIAHVKSIHLKDKGKQSDEDRKAQLKAHARKAVKKEYGDVTIAADLSGAQVPFQVPLEVNVVLIGFNGDGGYRYPLDGHKLEQFLKMSFPLHRPSCFETGEPIDIEHHIMYNVIAAGQPELISLEKSLKEAMVPAGTARESEYGREFPLLEVEATTVEPIFERLYSFIFDMEPGYSAKEMDRPVPVAIFVVNFDKVRMDPRNKEVDLDSLMYDRIGGLTEQELKKQEADYIYRYRYNGGGATQVWLSSGRFVVIDLSAGPCTYGKIETEEGSVSYRSMPRLSQIIFPRGLAAPSASSTQDIFIGQLGGLISTTVEHVIAPDVRFETVDMTVRLLIPIIVLQNHNRYNILQAGHNYSIDVQAIEREVKKMVHAGQEIIIISGSHALHQHEKLAVAVSKAMRSHSLHETKTDGRFHVRTKTYLDGAILKEEMERSADVLSAGLLEVSDPSLSSRFFLKQHWMDEQDDAQDSIKHRPIWESYMPRNKKEKRGTGKKKHGNLYRTYGTRVIPVFVLSLAGVDAELLMEEESLVWTSKDVVIVLEHNNEKIPLSYVSETTRQFAFPSLAQRHILAGLASAVGGLSAPYERASHIHERPIVNWLWAAGCHPFGPFSNSTQISQILQDVALRTTIYARVDAALRKIRDTSESVQSFASEHLKTPLGELVKGNKNKSSTELWVEKFYKKVTSMPEPFPRDLVERLEEYLDRLEGQLVDLSSLLYDHRLVDAYQNSSDILQSTIFTQQYVERVLSAERDKMKCCSIEYSHPKQSSQAFVYGGILLAGFLVYSLVIFFSSPVR